MIAFAVLAFCGGFLTCAVVVAALQPSPEVDADRRSMERFDRQRRALTGRRLV